MAELPLALEQDICKIRDIFFAAFLYALGHKVTLERHGVDDDGVTFVFEGGVSEEIISLYFNDCVQFLVPVRENDMVILTPKKLSSAFRDLRDMSRRVSFKK